MKLNTMTPHSEIAFKQKTCTTRKCKTATFY